MREIKFRAWTKEDEQMLSVNQIDWTDDNTYIFSDTTGYDYTKEDIILMQYTGLKDKNDKEIYEGDIVINHGYFNKGIVKFGSFKQSAQSKHDRPYWCQGFYANGQEVKSLLGMKYKLTENYSIEKSEDTLEVIGNIYKNPELIK